jgi:branched-subunit amino acid aminotransferase/4-amino-4-deoxychorismate lyase
MTKLIINGHEATHAQQELSTFHGSSFFTTMRSCEQKILLWERHWQRLSAHAEYFKFKLPDKNNLYNIIIHELASKTNNQKIRIIISRSSYALTFEAYEKSDQKIYQGVRICVSKFQTHPQLAAYKTSNSLPYMLAHEEAQERKVYEALLLDQNGYISDGSRTSIMLFDGLNLISLLGGLEGCMREEALDYAKQVLEIPVRHEYKKPEDLQGQILLANSLIGVVPVGEIRYAVVEQLINNFCV